MRKQKGGDILVFLGGKIGLTNIINNKAFQFNLA